MKAILLVLVPLVILGLVFGLGVSTGHRWGEGALARGIFSGFWAGFGLMVAAAFLNGAVGKLDKLLGTPPAKKP